MSRVMSESARWLATGFGAGYVPLAPGTAGSAVGLLLFWPMAPLPWTYPAVACAAVSVTGALAAAHVADRVGLKDPGIVVVDEIVGMWVALIAVPFSLLTAAAAFVLFRAMDVLKPWPARDLERLPGGWGIVADDLAAGVYANLLLRVGLLVWPAT